MPIKSNKNKHYCEANECDTEADWRITPGDKPAVPFDLCESCYETYCRGLRHGRMIAEIAIKVEPL